MNSSLEVSFSGGVVTEILKLQSVENGNMGNYTRVDRAVDKLRYHVYDLVMGTIFSELAHQRPHAKIGYSRY